VILTGANQDEVWPLVRDFHYSRRMPGSIQHCYAIREAGGLFGETGEIIAAAIFSNPPTRWSESVLELSRLVRRDDATVPLTQLLGFATKWLKAAGHGLLVSFADRTHGHHGGIYQAASWHYAGFRDRRMDGLIIDGEFKPGRSCNSLFGTRSPTKLAASRPDSAISPHYDEGKHCYWKALTIYGKTRAKRLGLAMLPYPKPNAARPLDEPIPLGVSAAQPHGAAPIPPAQAKQEAML
jgi:hypothetical protein